MKVLSGSDFARLVERRGWRLLRVSGSHHIYGKPGTVVRLSIPIHGNRPLVSYGIWRNWPKFLPKSWNNHDHLIVVPGNALEEHSWRGR